MAVSMAGIWERAKIVVVPVATAAGYVGTTVGNTSSELAATALGVAILGTTKLLLWFAFGNKLKDRKAGLLAIGVAVVMVTLLGKTHIGSEEYIKKCFEYVLMAAGAYGLGKAVVLDR